MKDPFGNPAESPAFLLGIPSRTSEGSLSALPRHDPRRADPIHTPRARPATDPPLEPTVGINGFGRMGRLAARVMLARGDASGLELVHVNELKGGADMGAYLLQFDSTHGRFEKECVADGDAIVVGGTRIKYTNHAKPEAIPWSEFGVEIVLECTGAFLTVESLQGHFARGAKKVVVSAPVDAPGILNVVVGCNESLVTPEMNIVTAASCTTNCAAPVIGALDAAFGIEMGSVNTVHNVTPTQSIMDVPNPGKKNDLRRARSGAVNLAPTTTGSSKAIALIYPHLKGKLDGLAIRVPCQNASITDLVLLVKKETTKEEVNAVLKAAAAARPGVFGYEERPLVSADYNGDARSTIIDALSTVVVSKRLIKVFAWYDNEWGYVNRLVELAELTRSISKL